MFFSKKKSVPYLMVGLGNPGEQYKNTRHNVGFCAIDCLEKAFSIEKTHQKMQSQMAFTTIADQKVILAKPQTYMNASGQAVGAISRYYHIPSERIFVFFDDVSLEPGRLRIRAKGSAGGHNGVQSVIDHLGDDRFVHIKIGVGAKPHPEYDLARWVLGLLQGEARQAVDQVLDKMPALAEALIQQDISNVMNQFNR